MVSPQRKKTLYTFYGSDALYDCAYYGATRFRNGEYYCFFINSALFHCRRKYYLSYRIASCLDYLSLFFDTVISLSNEAIINVFKSDHRHTRHQLSFESNYDFAVRWWF